jgi:imidazolonepropionase-like amidohydrolase
VDQAKESAAEQKRLGYDFLKVYWGLSVESFDAVMETGRTLNMPVVGHVPDAVGLSHALRSGIRSIEHLTGYEHALELKASTLPDQSIWARLDETQFGSIARETAQAGTWNCPTLVVYQNHVAPGEIAYLRRMLDRPPMKYVSPETVQYWYPENNYLKNSTPAKVASTRDSDRTRKKLVEALHKAGARLLLGTDYPNPFVLPGFSIHDELRNFVDANLSPYEAIRAGTSGAAEFLGASAEWGTVAVGRRADLILVEANPLEDVANASKQIGVMVRGRWYPKEELQVKLDALAEKYAVDGSK